MPTLTQLEYILAVNKHRHFGRAAKACHVSQPSLSAQIQKVEEELNTVIFDRSQKPISTTEVGKKIVQQAQTVIEESLKLNDIATETDVLSGEFHLGVIPTLSSYIIPLFIRDFSERFPNVQLIVSELETAQIVKQLAESELDAAVLATPLEEKQIVEKPLFLEPFYAFVADEHEFSKRKFLREEDLDSENIWLLKEGHCLRSQVLKICSNKVRNRFLKNVEFESGSLETLKNLVRNGSGYTLLPFLATKTLSRKEHEQNLKRFHKPIPTREVSLVHSPHLKKKKIADEIRNSIEKNLPPFLQKFKKADAEVIPL